MKKCWVIVCISCLLLISSSFGRERVIVHHTDLVDSPTSYVIPFGHVTFTLRVYPAPLGPEDSLGVRTPLFIGNGVLFKLRTAPFKNLILGVSFKQDGFISSGAPPTPSVEDVGVLLRYKILEEPVSFTMGIDVIEYVRWERRRGLYATFGWPTEGYKNILFPYFGGSAFFEKGRFIGGAFGGAEITPLDGVNFVLDWSWISAKGHFFDAGIRARLGKGLWLEFAVRDILDVIGNGHDWNRMLRIWYEWEPALPR